MSKKLKIIISIFAMVWSILSSSIGVGLVSESGLDFLQRFLCNAVFMIQVTVTMWCVFAVFRKTKED